MSKPKNVKISSAYLFNEAAYYYDLYKDTNDKIAYGRYCELRDIMIEYRFGKESLHA